MLPGLFGCKSSFDRFDKRPLDLVVVRPPSRGFHRSAFLHGDVSFAQLTIAPERVAKPQIAAPLRSLVLHQMKVMGAFGGVATSAKDVMIGHPGFWPVVV